MDLRSQDWGPLPLNPNPAYPIPHQPYPILPQKTKDLALDMDLAKDKDLDVDVDKDRNLALDQDLGADPLLPLAHALPNPMLLHPSPALPIHPLTRNKKNSSRKKIQPHCH